MTRKVLFMTAWYPTPERPVAGVFVREHALAAAQENEVVVLHCQGAVEGLPATSEVVFDEAESAASGLRTYRARFLPASWAPASFPRRMQSAFQAFRRIVEDGFRPDVLHAHVYTAAFPAVLLGRRHGIPVVATEHWSGFPRRALSRTDVLQARIAFAGAKRVLPVSRALERGIRDYGVRASFAIVPNVVDTSMFQPRRQARAEGPQRLLFVGHLAPIKGVDHLLRACALLRDRRAGWRLDLVGDGPDRAAYEALARGLGLDGLVFFHGQRPKPDVARFMQDADVFVLASLWDNMPCVLVEAMASGLPIVASDVGGIPEIVDPDAGHLARPGDPEDLAAKLERALDDAPKRDPDLLASRAVERYGYQSVGRALSRIYAEVGA